MQLCSLAGELLECFQWDAASDRDEVADELADVLTYALLLADRLDLDEYLKLWRPPDIASGGQG
ncbi:MazG-like family protein [Brachybacterium fresconis]|uniref:NTP pyrophosphatase (Non-canonical NTP hydrolase) n=1 Tax=Brachybacterium fresconis TaxID=173363 RepID=A0ABS4YN70_9MICO|nr:NTP pyrophosphatase (non-canonical NTP hydrolase) [Brachybacterium fresconis]